MEQIHRFTFSVDFINKIFDQNINETLTIAWRFTFADTVNDAESRCHGIANQYISTIAVYAVIKIQTNNKENTIIMW